jgi:hypothetical protein
VVLPDTGAMDAIRRRLGNASPVRWARAHPFAADSLLALLLAGVSLVPLWAAGHGAPSPLAVGMVLLINLPLAWRHRWPLVVGPLVAAASIAYGIAPYPDLGVPVPLGALVAFYTTMAYCSRRTATLIAVGACSVALVGMLLPVTDADPVDFAFAALLLGSTWAIGDSARSRRAYTAELEERAARLERERELEASRAVAEERARIARELHDVVAHHVSMMVVQAEAGPVTVERDPGTAAQAFDAIGAIGRQALGEMRRLLGVLRSGDDALRASHPSRASSSSPRWSSRSARLASRRSWRSRETGVPCRQAWTCPHTGSSRKRSPTPSATLARERRGSWSTTATTRSASRSATTASAPAPTTTATTPATGSSACVSASTSTAATSPPAPTPTAASPSPPASRCPQPDEVQPRRALHTTALTVRGDQGHCQLCPCRKYMQISCTKL